MQPYVIKQGDFLALLAHKFGFDADTVWNDPSNADLKKVRSDPNILWPTDILHIPDPIEKEPVTHALVTGQTNAFVADVPTLSVSLRFADAPLASQGYTVPELPDLVGLTTTADGTATFEIPVTLGAFTIAFTESGLAFTCNTGALDPIDTVSGVFQRLQHLGYIDHDIVVDAVDIDTVRAALRAFKAVQSGGQTGAASPDAAAMGSDNAGLSDDGSLDDDTFKLLLAAHPC